MDRELLLREWLAGWDSDMGPYSWWSFETEFAERVRAALAQPAQAAADAAGVLRQVAGYLTAQERVTAALSGMDGKEPGFNAEAWVDNWKQAVRERDLAQEVLESLDAAHVSALAGALEVQG